MNYILVDGKPVLEPDIIKWGKWFQEGDKRRIREDTTTHGVDVSTVFLGLDHSFGSGPPVLWETMIFGGEFDQDCQRYTSEEEAIQGHSEMLAKAASGKGREE